MLGHGLLASETVVVRAAERQGLRRPVTNEKPAQTVHDPPSSAPNRSSDGKLNDLDGDCFTPRTAQTGHAVPSIVGNPNIDQALWYAKAGGGFGAAPPIDKDALYDQCALRHGDGARLGGQMVHVLLTLAAAQQFQVD